MSNPTAQEYVDNKSEKLDGGTDAASNGHHKRRVGGRLVDDEEYPRAEGRPADPLPDDDQGDKKFQKSAAWYRDDELARREGRRQVAELDAASDEVAWPDADLAAMLDGLDDDATEPMMCMRSDEKVGLFYAGHSNLVVSLSGAGKTWLLLLAAVERIALGEDVTIWDFEEPNVKRNQSRLRAIVHTRDDVTMNDVLKHLHYKNPTQRVGGGDIAAARKSSLVLQDGIGKALKLHGLKSDDGVLTYDAMLVTPLTSAGVTVVGADHQTKSKDNQDTPYGSVYKINQVSGAVVILRCKVPMGIGRRGVSGVYRTSKDRGGRLAAAAVDEKGEQLIADLVVDATVWGKTSVSLVPPAGAEDRTRAQLMQRAQRASEILEHLADDEWVTKTLATLKVDDRKDARLRTMLEQRSLNKTGLSRLMGGNNVEASDGINYLLGLNPPHVEEDKQAGRGRGTWLRLIKPFRTPTTTGGGF